MTTEAARAIEAILMVAQEPIDPHLLAQLLEVPPARVEELCTELQTGYEAQQRGFVLARVAGGYRFQSHGDLAPYVERFVLEGQSAKLSAAALETLAIVAYKQPLSRAQVASIRGVNVDGVMRTLQQRGYVVEVGKDPGPGQATLFGTSREFLERMGLDRIEDLPPIAALFPSTEVMEALERGLRADPVTEPAAVADPEAEGDVPDPPPLGEAPTADAGPEVEVEVEAEDERGAEAPAAAAEVRDGVTDHQVEGPEPEAEVETETETEPAGESDTTDAGPGLEGEAEDATGAAPAVDAESDLPGSDVAGTVPVGVGELDDLDEPVPPLEEPSWVRRDDPSDHPGDGGEDDAPLPPE